MIHNGNKDPVINMVNYLANSSGNKGCDRFYSFIEVVGSPYWCWKHSDKYYAAVSYFEEPIDRPYSDDCEEKEKKQISKGLVWVALLGGSDNTSYIKRFRTKEKMMKWMLETKTINGGSGSLLWVNS